MELKAFTSHMHLTVGLCALGIAAFFFMTPFKSTQAAATGVSFGGQVITVDPTCINGVLITIRPAGASPIKLIWTPGASQTFRNGPPTHPGQWVLGTAIPGVCYKWFPGWPYWYIGSIPAMQITVLGTSL